jgi:hypothetical protein
VATWLLFLFPIHMRQGVPASGVPVFLQYVSPPRSLSSTKHTLKVPDGFIMAVSPAKTNGFSETL